MTLPTFPDDGPRKASGWVIAILWAAALSVPIVCVLCGVAGTLTYQLIH